MTQIVPTITAENPHVYREQIERVQSFAKRIHIDLMDGKFTPNTSLDTTQVWLPKDIVVDMHVMFENPNEALNVILQLKPSLVVIPVETDHKFEAFATALKEADIRFGVAILAATTVDSVKEKIARVDHVLIFSGNLGYQGGSVADLSLLDKVSEIKLINPTTEIGWDGGVDDQNVGDLADGGIQVINVGGYIHSAKQPEVAYNNLASMVGAA